MPPRETIFVQIPSYRDPECHLTLRSLFEKAARPERISVGICWQYDPEEDAHFLKAIYPYPERVRIKHYHPLASKGSGWACNEANALWEGETYTLQVHAHMRFEQNWDDYLIQNYKQCEGDKKLVTFFPPYYHPPLDELAPPEQRNRRIRVNYLGTENDPQMVHLTRALMSRRDPRRGIYPSPFVIFNFIFAESGLFKTLPFDPHIYFWGEELAYAVRLWTHGYTIFQLPQPVAYHQWHNRRTPGMKEYKVEDNPNNIRSLKRLRHLLGLEESYDPEVIEELEHYALGHVRALEDFWKYSGVDLKRRIVKRHALEGFWNTDLLEQKPAMDTISSSHTGLSKINLPQPKLAQNATESVKPMQPKEPMSDDFSPRPRIFVQIASYRDPECQHTIKDLFERAAHPERIFAGICWQVHMAEDHDCFHVPYPYPAQVRERKYSLEKSRGSGWARAEAMKLYGGEEYILQIDSHMRFEPGWDEALLEMLSRAPSEQAVISAALLHYTPGQNIQYAPRQLGRIAVSQITATNRPAVVRLIMRTLDNLQDERNGIYPTPVPMMNFLFAPAEAFTAVPVDPYIFHNGDEISYAARLWTHGWDIYQPDRSIAYHYWEQPETAKTRTYREDSAAATQHSCQRVRHLLGLEVSDDEEALKELDRYGHGIARPLEHFWPFLGVDLDKHIISKYAYQGFWHMLKNGETSATQPQRSRIFVQIASYRDPECQHTIKDLFERAAHPERIFAGICWQYIQEEDAHCFEVEPPFPDQVRIKHVDARESKGACWARSETQKLWNGEEFTLQIDSHMRFEPGWDETLLKMFEDCGNPRAVISTYPPGYTPPNKLEREWIFGIAAKEFNTGGIFTMKGYAYPINRPPALPPKGAFIGACFLFGPSSIIHDVPYDPHLYFFGEEISLSARLWTHGYDIYYPNKPVAYHDWNRSKRKSTHFSDHKDWGLANDLSYQRVRYMLNREEPANPEALKELDRYGLGNARSLEEYEAYCGVDFAHKKIVESSYNCVFPAPKTQNVSSTGAKASTTPILTVQAQVRTHAIAKTIAAPEPVINTAQPLSGERAHTPRKTFESPEAIVYDDFLPEDVFEQIYNFAVEADYNHINTTGKISRVWNIDNGFPLRSAENYFFHTREKKNPKPDYVYPTGKTPDLFIDQINAINPQVRHLIGEREKDWEHFSVTSWLYPPDTGLSLHNDGAGIYSGAYVFFLNPEWRLHWGGLLLMLGKEVNDQIEQRRKDKDGYSFYRRKWLHHANHDEMAMSSGYAQCIFPKRNRIVFIANDAYHMVTKVNATAGDNVRMSFAGFFNRGKK